MLHDESYSSALRDQGQLVCSELLSELNELFHQTFNSTTTVAESQTFIDHAENLVRCRLHDIARSVLGERPVWNGLPPFRVVNTPEIIAAREVLASDPSAENQAIINKFVRSETIRLAREYYNSLNHLPANDLFKKISAHLKNRQRPSSALSNSVRALSLYRGHFAKIYRNDLLFQDLPATIFDEDLILDESPSPLIPVPVAPMADAVAEVESDLRLESDEFIRVPSDPTPRALRQLVIVCFCCLSLSLSIRRPSLIRSLSSILVLLRVF